MKYVLNADQMKASDSRMIQQIGIPSLVLMERAAQQCVAQRVFWGQRSGRDCTAL